MEGRVVLRGALSGFVAGIFAFVFARIFAEPFIQQAIDYESGRDDALNAIAKAQGVSISTDGPEIFSRTVQSNIGLATGIVGFATAMGALVAVAYLVLQGRFNIRPRTLALLIAGFGFLGVYLVPFVKYPANPPSIGHTFTITTRGHLYLAMVGGALIGLALAVLLANRIKGRFGVFNATLIAGAAFIVVISVLMAVLPSLGHLAANEAVASSTGYAHSATETPPVITNPQGQIVYPGFPADILWKFRLYSVIAQLIAWGGVGLLFSGLLERLYRKQSVNQNAPEPLAV